MTLSNLKKIQFIYPGLYTFWVLYFIIKASFIETNPFDNYKYYVICLTISTLYHTLSARELLFTPIKKRIIDSNIRDQMFAIFTTSDILTQKSSTCIFFEKLVKKQKKSLESINCMHCFYRCIDRDATLKVKSEIVMFNGSILCCIIDTILISFALLVLLFIDYITKIYSINYINVLHLLLAIFFVSLFLLPISIATHVKLSNNQLEYIFNNKESLIKELNVGICSKCKNVV